MARIFLAGASGLIGQRLVPLLVQAGHHVIGTTRTGGKTALLRSLGATPVVVDVGACLVVVAEAPENEGVPEQVYDPAVAIFDKDQVVRLGRSAARG